MTYIDILVRRIREKVSSLGSGAAIVDMVQWPNFTTFDIVGDLALGESFHCLEGSRYHGWVSILFTQFPAAALRFSGLDKPLRLVVPRSLLKKRADHANTANERIHRRLDQSSEGTDAQRNDFMACVPRYNDEKGMSVPEIEATFRVLIVASSITTETTLSGIMGNLLQNPDAMGHATEEIRLSFQHPSEISAERESSLPYLNAVIEEALRLCPPVALGMPRMVPVGGAKASGHWLPGGVSFIFIVLVEIWASWLLM